MRLILLALALLGSATAECPNACSGHGTCALHDQCECCRNFGGADCSERICPFGSAHVDTPKGDVDGSTGTLSGPSTTLITGSNVYPFGTTEQYPNLDVDEAHAYMECSNKGLCNRDDGTCECFQGYEGSACQRASCPNDCSGHGTCETIKELAEDKEDGDLAIGAYGEQGYADYTAGMGDLSGIGYLKYELWDKTLTMGCKCDPGFTGPDCSLKLCRYGVDPLFIPSSHKYSAATGLDGGAADLEGGRKGVDSWAIIDDDGLSESAPQYEQSFVEIATWDSMNHIEADVANNYGNDPSLMSGTFDLVIYDVYGEKYTLDHLKYAHFDERTAIGDRSDYWSDLGHNHTTCEEIMAYFPNDKLKDTTMGSWQNQMQHKGGLVSTAYVTGSTKSFCSVTSARGQNVTTNIASPNVKSSGPQHSETLATIAECGKLDGALTAGVTTITLKDNSGTCAPGATPPTIGLFNGDRIKLGSEVMKLVSNVASDKTVTVVRGVDGTTAAAHADGDELKTITYKITEAWGIRYNFDYNRGNPGYHKDLYIENLIPAPGQNIPVKGFYGTIKQGMVAEIRGDEADDRRSKSYDITLPGYVMAAAEGGTTILFSEDLSSYLAGTDERIGTSAGRVVDHKTAHIYMLGYYYEIKATQRVIVDIESAVPRMSDYMIGEWDVPTNATVSTFATLATLQTANAQVDTFANVLGATPDDEDRGRAGCLKTAEFDTAACGNSGKALNDLTTAIFNPKRSKGTDSTIALTAKPGATATNDFVTLATDTVGTKIQVGDFLQIEANPEILWVADIPGTQQVTVLRGVDGTTLTDSAGATDAINKIVNDGGNACTASKCSNYKNTVSFLHSTEGLARIYCTGGYPKSIVNGNYVCQNMAGVNTATRPGTDVSGEVRVTVKAKLTQPYQYVSECSNRGSCDRETGLCRCFTGYTHDNCDTQTPVC